MARPEASRPLLRRLFASSERAEAGASSESAVFLQQRVALFLKFQWILLGAFFLIDATAGLRQGNHDEIFQPSLVLHGSLVAAFMAIWW